MSERREGTLGGDQRLIASWSAYCQRRGRGGSSRIASYRSDHRPTQIVPYQLFTLFDNRCSHPQPPQFHFIMRKICNETYWCEISVIVPLNGNCLWQHPLLSWQLLHHSADCNQQPTHSIASLHWPVWLYHSQSMIGVLQKVSGEQSMSAHVDLISLA